MNTNYEQLRRLGDLSMSRHDLSQPNATQGPNLSNSTELGSNATEETTEELTTLSQVELVEKVMELQDKIRMLEVRLSSVERKIYAY